MNEERRADAVIAAFARLWPKCFFVASEDRQPLMTGIHHHLRKHLQPMIDAQRISSRDIELALSRYTDCEAYQRKIASDASTVRIGLLGEKRGRVIDKQRQHAREWLSQRGQISAQAK